MKKILSGVVLGLFVLGCATTTKSNLTPGMAKKYLVKGETSQSEVLQIFGAPNIITKNKSGNEVWTYDKISSEAATSHIGGAGGVIGLPGTTPAVGGMTAGGARSSSSTRTLTLIIEFDENDVVKDFSYRSSEF
ncbi:MAG: hypothetical protein AB1472_03020 [Candidatus Omnitrophota bacterium]